MKLSATLLMKAVFLGFLPTILIPTLGQTDARAKALLCWHQEGVVAAISVNTQFDTKIEDLDGNAELVENVILEGQPLNVLYQADPESGRIARVALFERVVSCPANSCPSWLYREGAKWMVPNTVIRFSALSGDVDLVIHEEMDKIRVPFEAEMRSYVGHGGAQILGEKRTVVCGWNY